MLVRRVRGLTAITRPASATRPLLSLAVAAVLAGCQAPPQSAPPAPENTRADTAAANTRAPTADAFERAEIMRLQTRLSELGFPAGPVDGIAGGQTAKAIKQYQNAHGLPVTGAISRDLLAHLETRTATATSAPPPSVSARSGGLPSYQPGTTFVYSNGEVDRVAAREGTAVKWIRSDGTTYTASRNFLLPWLTWATDEKRGTAAVAEPTGDLWPLRKGAKVAYSATVSVQRRDDPDSTEQRRERWQCRNEGSEKITVHAGTFDTLVLKCLREASAAAPAVVRTWHYAPSVRHFVRFAERDPRNNAVQTIDLVAVRPDAPDWPPIARAALERAIVKTLEAPDGEPAMDWTSSGVATRVTIAAKPRFVAANGKSCRHFEQNWTTAGDSRRYYALACRAPAGGWQIPGLDSNTAGSLVTSGEVS